MAFGPKQMRDPHRIRPLMGKIELLWVLQPDLRFPQLISYIEHGLKRQLDKDDLYNVEDDEVEKVIDALIEKRRSL